MRASRRKHHIIYKTTCLATGRFYIGMHSTDDLNDTYLGSGLRLRRSIEKYGKDQHVRVILEDLPTREAAAERERELITPELRADPQCLNCGPGGLGVVDRPPTRDEIRVKFSQLRKQHYASEAGELTKRRLSEALAGKSKSDEIRRRMSEGTKGVKKSDEHRAAMSAVRRGKLQSPERRARTRTGRERPCTLDGTTIYPSHAALVKAHGHGKNGGRSPNLRYL